MSKVGADSATSRLKEEIWQWVHAIPPGRVATYGQIAGLSGYPSHARFVGTTLKNLPKGTTLPWHRVLKSSGALAFPPGSAHHRRQRDLLAQEGVLLLKSGRVPMKECQWQP
jgi:methylated-DNA-protein-cysteine methyltransferase related protein